MTTEAPVSFFSYCRDDSKFALQLAGDLRAAGAIVWLDQIDIAPGRRWDSAVEDALTNCQQMLVILSPASVESTNVLDEVSFALETQKTVIPVLYRDCAIPFRLRRVQYVDFRPDYAQGLKQLLKTLEAKQPAERAPDKASGMSEQNNGVIDNKSVGRAISKLPVVRLPHPGDAAQDRPVTSDENASEGISSGSDIRSASLHSLRAAIWVICGTMIIAILIWALTRSPGPTATIFSPMLPSGVKTGDTIVIAGKASDTGGRRVAAVEVSTDGGASWHPGQGQEQWTYLFTPCEDGTYSLTARAINGSGKIGTRSAPVSITAAVPQTTDFVNNGQFSCGFTTVNDSHGSGLCGKGWFHWTNSLIATTLEDAGAIAGVHVQRVIAFGAGDGIGQHLNLVVGQPYQLNARIYAESGRVALKIGKYGQADDKLVITTGQGRWEDLSLVYVPTQAACTFVVYSDGGASTFKVADVRIGPPAN